MFVKVMAFYQFITLLVLTSAMPFEVFLSFRGIDTRYTFTDHLYRRLKQAGFRTFRDKEGIRRGENIDLEIEKAIYASKASVIVFSKNYASSTSCLNELKLIMERRRTVGHVALPVFYRVNPSHVGEQTGTYGDAFTEHRKNVKVTMDMIEGWRAALTEVADLAGMPLEEGYETEFLDEIVKEVEVKLNRTGLPSLAEIIRRTLELKERCKSRIFPKIAMENENEQNCTEPSRFNSFIKVTFLVLLICPLVILYSILKPQPPKPLPTPVKPDLVSRTDDCVFLSYRELSSSKNFTYRLYAALKKSGISTCISNGIWYGKQKEILEKELDKSKICIIVFSKEYASLPYCLEQLVMIMEHRKTSRHTVAPIFYDVARRDVVEQQGSYKAAFKNHEKNHPIQVGKWKEALQQVSGLKEMNLEGRNNEESIQLIVKEIENRLTGLDNA